MKSNLFRSVCMVFFVCSLLLVLGCGTPEYMHRTKGPGMNATQTVTRYDAKNYDILGLVMAEGESRSILGIITEGTEGEGLLWDVAKSQFGDRVTGIKDINISYEYQSILGWVFCEIKTTYTGTAVHEK